MITDIDNAKAAIVKHGFLKVKIEDSPIAYTGSVLNGDKQLIESNVAAQVVEQLSMIFRGGVGGVLLYELKK